MPELLSCHRMHLLAFSMMIAACSDPADSNSIRTGQLLFSGRDEAGVSLYIVDDSGGTPHLLAPNAAFGRWSPDGRQVVFERWSQADAEIIVRDVLTGVEANISQHPAVERAPDWSPNGRQIVFVSDRDGEDHLYVMERDGSDVRPLGVRGSSPAWSPDGQWIAFPYHHLPDRLFSGALAVIRPDGSGLRRLTDYPDAELEPAWTPDGKHLLFSRAVPREDHEVSWEVVRFSVDGTGSTVLASHPDSSFTSTVVGPHGEIIVTAGEYGFRGNYRLFRLASDGSNRLPAGITYEGDQFDPDCHWSAD
jgi:Tol biopolymer transport system component